MCKEEIVNQAFWSYSYKKDAGYFWMDWRHSNPQISFIKRVKEDSLKLQLRWPKSCIQVIYRKSKIIIQGRSKIKCSAVQIIFKSSRRANCFEFEKLLKLHSIWSFKENFAETFQKLRFLLTYKELIFVKLCCSLHGGIHSWDWRQALVKFPYPWVISFCHTDWLWVQFWFKQRSGSSGVDSFPTDQMFDGNDGADRISGIFKQAMRNAFSAFQDNKNVIIDFCDVFIDDPLMEWIWKCKK